MKRFFVLVGMTFFVAAMVVSASIVVNHKRNESKSDIVATTQPVTSTAVLGDSVSKTGDYNIVANHAQLMKDGTLAVDVTVKNNGASALQLSPYLQFRLVNAQTHTVLPVAVPKGTQTFGGGPLSTGASVSGTLYFNASSVASVELQFMSDVSQNQFVALGLPTIVQ